MSATPRPLERVMVFLATGFGVGWIPVAPGTFGSLLGLPLTWGLWLLPDPARWALSLVVILVGIPICGVASRVLGSKDPGAVVWDEIAAFPIVFLLVPVTLRWAVAGFLLFRLFDIWKPWPARRLEQLPGGVGVMADDLAAGVFAGAALTLLAVVWK